MVVGGRLSGIAVVVMLVATPAFADSLATIAPLALGQFPVGCSNVEQDFTRIQPGESARQYWEGFPTGGQERYVDQLLLDPAHVLRVALPVPDDRELYVDRATSTVAYDFLVC